MTRTFVVGLDGASWDLLEPWIERGSLPNLATLRQEGAWARSRSCLPPVTFPNWKCYSSGKDPGGFGVFWFERIDLEEERIEIQNATDFRTAELWDYLNLDGFSTGVVNMPTMYPPRDIDGVIVSGGPDAVDGEHRSIEGRYTYPAELSDQLRERYGYSVHPSPLLSSNRERGPEVEAILDLVDRRFEVALDLFEERQLDFMHVTIFYINVLHHFFWNDRPTERAWKRIDHWLDRIHGLPDTNVIVMSDHGTAQTRTEFYINEWLAETGYLTKRRSIEDYFLRFGLTRENALAVAKRLGLVNSIASVVPERLQQLVPLEAGAKRQRKLEKIDIDATRAIASGQGPVYVNPNFDRTETVRRLRSDLGAVTDDRGEPLFDGVFRAEDVYSGPYASSGPAIVVDQSDGVHVNDGIGGGDVFTKPDRWAAENARHGIFIATGPDIEERGSVDQIDIVDIAPTLLAAYDVAVPTDMSGSVLPIFESDKDIEDQEPLPPPGQDPERSEMVANRLKELGYME